MVKEPRQTSFFHVGEVVDLWLVFGDVSRANKQAKQKTLRSRSRDHNYTPSELSYF